MPGRRAKSKGVLWLAWYAQVPFTIGETCNRGTRRGRSIIKRSVVWLNAALVVPACLSLRTGVRHGLERGQDFQWSGAHLAALHLDPYRQYLSGDPEHLILLAQTPNYLHELYVLLMPLGAMQFRTARAVWVGINVALLVAIVLGLRRMYQLGTAETVLLLLLTVVGAPFRILLGNGQQSLLELFFFCVVFSTRGTLSRGLSLGLSYAKYSFAPVLVVFLLLRRRYGELAVSSIPVLLGLVGLWIAVHGSLWTLAQEPFLVSHTGVTPGLGDGMSLVWAIHREASLSGGMQTLMYFVALALSVGCAIYIMRCTKRSGERAAAAMLAVASLLCLTHLTYDYIFLMVPLAAGLSSQTGPRGGWIAGVVAVVWSLLTFSNRVPDMLIPELQVLVFCVLAGLLVVLGRMSKNWEKEPLPDVAGQETIPIGV